jgi:hypothetical protein
VVEAAGGGRDFAAQPNVRARVSIIIPVGQDAALLARSLEYLYHSSYPRHLIEVIVVDSESDDRSAWLSRAGVVVIRAKGRQAELFNRGARAALGEILAFTSPSADFGADWIERAVEALANGQAAWLTAAGLVVRRTPFEHGGGFDRLCHGDPRLELCNRLRLAGHLVAAEIPPSVAA